MLDAGCTAPLIGDFHYNGHLLLTKFPDCARALDKYRINPGNVGTGRRRDEQFSTICRVAVELQPAGADRRQRRLAQPGAGRREDAGEHRSRSRQVVGRHHQRVHDPLGARVDRARHRKRSAPRSDHHLLQDVASPRSDRRLPRAGEADRSAAASRPDRSGDGHQGSGVVGVGDGRAAQRGHRRHDSRVADAAPRRRSPRRGLRRVRTAAGAGAAIVLTQRHRLSRLRPDDELDLPGTGRTHSGLRPRQDAAVEDRSTRASKR